MKPLVFKKRRRMRNRPAPRLKLHITKGDKVMVISGESAGKESTVLHVYPKTGRVTVKGVNIIKRHYRAGPNREAGIVEREAPIHHSKVMLIDPKTGEPTRIRRQKDTDGTIERIAVKSGLPIPRSR